MDTLTSLHELIELLPLSNIGEELKGPCPFCSPVDKGGSPSIIKNNITFYGNDRFFLFPDNKGWGCRICKLYGRGPTGRGWWPHSHVAEALGKELTKSFLLEVGGYAPTENPLQYWSYAQTASSHKEIILDYWKSFGWFEETINRFLLGYGKISNYHLPGHLIPMDVTHVALQEKIPGYLIALRLGGDKIRQKGSVKPYLWHIRDDEFFDTVVVTEGEKDAISAWQIGWKNVSCSFGTSWNSQKSDFLASKYKTVIVIPDRGAPGEKFSEVLSSSLSDSGLQVQVFDWSKVSYPEEIDDLTELLIIEKDNTKTIIESHLVEFISENGEGTSRSLLRENQFTAPQSGVISLDEIRNNGSLSLEYAVKSFLRNYNFTRGKGHLLMLATGPGAGKTYRLYKTAEEVALANQKEGLKERERLMSDLDDLKTEYKDCSDPDERGELRSFLFKMESLLERHSLTTVVWYAPYKQGFSELEAMGADRDLWFDFQARSETNCENYRLAVTLGEMNHNLGGYCELACPFKEDCREEGYLKQVIDSRNKSIVFYRHQHLLAAPVPASLIVLDEFAGHIIEEPLEVSPQEVSAFNVGWDLGLDDQGAVDEIRFLERALKSVIAFNAGEVRDLPNGESNPNYCISGSRILLLLEKEYQKYGRQIINLLYINPKLLKTEYQPSFLGGEENYISKRCVPRLWHALTKELPAYVKDNNNKKPSCLHLIAGKLHVYHNEPIRIRAATPIIVADATTIPEVYEGMFIGRKVEIYNPKFHNPNAVVTVVHGSDWTKSYIQSQLGPELVSRRGVLDSNIVSFLGDTIDLKDVPTLSGVYNSKIVRDAFIILSHLISKHPSILIVTHKNLRELLESIAESLHPEWGDENKVNKVAWGHYGALRGTNKYEKYEALALIGAFRLPYDVLWRKIQMWAFLLGLEDIIPPDLVKKTLPYGDSQGLGHDYPTFDHWFADKFVNMAEQGEMRQCAERIRPHSTDRAKYIYIFCSRPVMPLANQIVLKSSYLKTLTNTTHKQLVSYLRSQKVATGKLPTYREARAKFRVSNRTIKEARALAQKEI